MRNLQEKQSPRNQPDFHQGKKEKQMLREDTGGFTSDRPWVSEGTLERFEDDRRGGQSFKQIGE